VEAAVHSNPRLAVKLHLSRAAQQGVLMISAPLKPAVHFYPISQILQNRLFNILSCLCQQGLKPLNKMMLRRGLRRTVINLLIRPLLKAVLRKRRSLPSLNTSYFVQQSVDMQSFERL
jgi:hypothetical protein